MIDLTDQLGLRIYEGKLGRTALDAAEDRLHTDVAWLRHRVPPLAQHCNAAVAVILRLLTTVKLLRLPAVAFAVFRGKLVSLCRLCDLRDDLLLGLGSSFCRLCDLIGGIALGHGSLCEGRKIHGCVLDQAVLFSRLVVSHEPLRDLEIMLELTVLLYDNILVEECLVLTQEEICRLNIFGIQLRRWAVSHRAVHDSLFWRRD